MPRLTRRLRITTVAFSLASSGAVGDPRRLPGRSCPEATGSAFDDVHLLQKFILQEVEHQHEGIAVVTASRTVQLGIDGQVTASAQPTLAQVRWPASGPEGAEKRLVATQDSTVAVLIVFIIGISTTMAVMMLQCLRIPVPLVHRRRRKAVEFPEIGETSALKTSMQQQLKMLEEVTDDTNWQGCWAEAMLCKQTPDTPSALPDPPAPMPSLRTTGASYVVPMECIKNATSTMLSFDIPILPPVWPLRAVLTRATPQSAWTKIDLTVDVIAAAELPPLLSCMGCSPSGEVRQLCSETSVCTGGTTNPDGQSGEGVMPCSRWLAMRNSGEAILASTTPTEKDPTRCTLQLQSHDRVSWDVNMRLDEREPSVVISRLGQGIGEATSAGHCRSQPPGEDSDASDDEDGNFLFNTFNAIRSAAEFHTAALAVRPLARDRDSAVPPTVDALLGNGAFPARDAVPEVAERRSREISPHPW
jgi:hypothetical protein